MLRFSKKYLPIATVKNMDRSLVEPSLRYSYPLWGNTGINAIDKSQKLQNRAVRIVTNSAYDTSALKLIRKLGWITINELIESEALEMVYKSVNNQVATYGNVRQDICFMEERTSQYQNGLSHSSLQIGFWKEMLLTYGCQTMDWSFHWNQIFQN